MALRKMLCLCPWRYGLTLTRWPLVAPLGYLGLIPMLDPPRHDTAETIARAQELGVSVKMLTGGTSCEDEK